MDCQGIPLAFIFNISEIGFFSAKHIAKIFFCFVFNPVSDIIASIDPFFFLADGF